MSYYDDELFTPGTRQGSRRTSYSDAMRLFLLTLLGKVKSLIRSALWNVRAWPFFDPRTLHLLAVLLTILWSADPVTVLVRSSLEESDLKERCVAIRRLVTFVTTGTVQIRVAHIAVARAVSIGLFAACALIVLFAALPTLETIIYRATREDLSVSLRPYVHLHASVLAVVILSAFALASLYLSIARLVHRDFGWRTVTNSSTKTVASESHRRAFSLLCEADSWLCMMGLSVLLTDLCCGISDRYISFSIALVSSAAGLVDVFLLNRFVRERLGRQALSAGVVGVVFSLPLLVYAGLRSGDSCISVAWHVGFGVLQLACRSALAVLSIKLSRSRRDRLSQVDGRRRLPYKFKDLSLKDRIALLKVHHGEFLHISVEPLDAGPQDATAATGRPPSRQQQIRMGEAFGAERPRLAFVQLNYELSTLRWSWQHYMGLDQVEEIDLEDLDDESRLRLLSIRMAHAMRSSIDHLPSHLSGRRDAASLRRDASARPACSMRSASLRNAKAVARSDWPNASAASHIANAAGCTPCSAGNSAHGSAGNSAHGSATASLRRAPSAKLLWSSRHNGSRRPSCDAACAVQLVASNVSNNRSQPAASSSQQTNCGNSRSPHEGSPDGSQPGTSTTRSPPSTAWACGAGGSFRPPATVTVDSVPRGSFDASKTGPSKNSSSSQLAGSPGSSGVLANRVGGSTRRSCGAGSLLAGIAADSSKRNSGEPGEPDASSPGARPSCCSAGSQRGASACSWRHGGSGRHSSFDSGRGARGRASASSSQLASAFPFSGAAPCSAGCSRPPNSLLASIAVSSRHSSGEQDFSPVSTRRPSGVASACRGHKNASPGLHVTIFDETDAERSSLSQPSIPSKRSEGSCVRRGGALLSVRLPPEIARCCSSKTGSPSGRSSGSISKLEQRLGAISAPVAPSQQRLRLVGYVRGRKVRIILKANKDKVLQQWYEGILVAVRAVRAAMKDLPSLSHARWARSLLHAAERNFSGGFDFPGRLSLLLSAANTREENQRAKVMRFENGENEVEEEQDGSMHAASSRSQHGGSAFAACGTIERPSSNFNAHDAARSTSFPSVSERSRSRKQRVLGIEPVQRLVLILLRPTSGSEVDRLFYNYCSKNEWESEHEESTRAEAERGYSSPSLSPQLRSPLRGLSCSFDLPPLSVPELAAGPFMTRLGSVEEVTTRDPSEGSARSSQLASRNSSAMRVHSRLPHGHVSDRHVKVWLSGWLRFCREQQRELDEELATELFSRACEERAQLAGPPAVRNVSARLGVTKSPVSEAEYSLTRLQLLQLLLSPANRAVDPAKVATVDDVGDLGAPLTHYWVAASHNSYLESDQLFSRSSADMYRRLLLLGCRSVEVDIWDGKNGEPIVTHGKTLCSWVPASDVIVAIAEAAFTTSSLPVVISLENRCSPPQQAKVAALLTEHLGAHLLLPGEIEAMGAAAAAELSPYSLRFRVILKAKVNMLPVASRKFEARGGGSFSNNPRNSSYVLRSFFTSDSSGGASSSSSRSNCWAGASTLMHRNSRVTLKSAGAAGVNDSASVARRSASFSPSVIRPRSLSLDSSSIAIDVDVKLRKRESWHTDAPEEGDEDFELRLNRRSSPVALAKQMRRVLATLKGVSFRSAPRSASRRRLSRHESPSVLRHESEPVDDSSFSPKRRSSRLVFTEEGQTIGRLHSPQRRAQALRRNMSSRKASKQVHDSLQALVALPQVSREAFLLQSPPPYELPLCICSFRETGHKELGATEKERAGLQRRTAARLMRVYPKPARTDSSNLDPLPMWRIGAHHVALNLQTTDLPTQLHYALFELNGGQGYVRKPTEMIDGSTWPPHRLELHHVQLRVLSLHQLPTRSEERPLISGACFEAHSYVPHLSGFPVLASASGTVSSPRIGVELHSIGGYSCVSETLPPPQIPSSNLVSPVVDGNGLNAVFNFNAHCLAAEPHSTIIRLVVIDGDTEAAFDTAVLGVLRPGYRNFQLRRPRTGTRIDMCHLLVHIHIGSEPHVWAQAEVVREQLVMQQELLAKQSAELKLKDERIAELEEQCRQLQQQRIAAEPLIRRPPPISVDSAELVTEGVEPPGETADDQPASLLSILRT